MKQRTFWLLIALSLMSAACSNKPKNADTPSAKGSVWEDAPVVASIVEVNGHPVTVLDWDKVDTKVSLPLSHFIEDLEIVKLDNRDDALVRGSSVLVSENYILVGLSKGIPVKLFDRKGKYLCDVGSMGGGPGEYNNTICHFQLDEPHNRIYLTTWNSSRILAYDLKGKFVHDIPLTESPEQNILPKTTFLVDTEKQSVIVATLPWGSTPHLVWTQDFQGKRTACIPAAPFEIERDYSNSINTKNNGPMFDLQVDLLTNAKEDTLYHYYPDKAVLEPVFTIDYAGSAASHEFFEHSTCFVGASASGDPMKEGKDLLIHRDKLFIVDKQTLRGGLYEIYNDFLGDIPVWWFPRSRYGYYARNLNPDMLMEELQEGLKNNDLTPEMRTKMKTLLDSIDEDDNNYILLGKLKK